MLYEFQWQSFVQGGGLAKKISDEFGKCSFFNNSKWHNLLYIS